MFTSTRRGVWRQRPPGAGVGPGHPPCCRLAAVSNRRTESSPPPARDHTSLVEALSLAAVSPRRRAAVHRGRCPPASAWWWHGSRATCHAAASPRRRATVVLSVQGRRLSGSAQGVCTCMHVSPCASYTLHTCLTCFALATYHDSHVSSVSRVFACLACVARVFSVSLWQRMYPPPNSKEGYREAYRFSGSAQGDVPPCKFAAGAKAPCRTVTRLALDVHPSSPAHTWEHRVSHAISTLDQSGKFGVCVAIAPLCSIASQREK